MASIINAGQSALTITPDTTGALTLQANGTNALQITANGQITTANAPFILTGGQIVFPGTQNASADGNTLDDYEEGTWTPSYSPSGSAFSSISYSADTTGRYIKIGKMVFVIFWIQVSSVSGGSGTVRIQGFPFTPESISNLNPGTVVHLASSWSTNTPYSIDYSTGTQFNLKFRSTANGSIDAGDISVSNLATNCFMRGSFCYQTSA